MRTVPAGAVSARALGRRAAARRAAAVGWALFIAVYGFTVIFVALG